MNHYYAWGNDVKRKTLKGRKCRIIARGSMNSRLIEFEDGQREVVSGNSLRKVKPILESDNEKLCKRCKKPIGRNSKRFCSLLCFNADRRENGSRWMDHFTFKS